MTTDRDYADKSWLRTPPKLDVATLFIALCILLSGAYLLDKLGIWA